MDTKQLITFVTFAKEKSYTKSSMKLNYAVSTLSEHISSLESELGVKLVESRGKRTTLTKNGEIFLDYANKMLSIYKEAQDAMASLNAVHGSLKVLTSESLGLYRAAPILARFAKAFPKVELSVSISNPNSFLEKLETEEADIVFCFGLSPYD
ncbi:MAG: LysR family transcriptional regulator, partial [Anaerotignum sp.]